MYILWVSTYGRKRLASKLIAQFRDIASEFCEIGESIDSYGLDYNSLDVGDFHMILEDFLGNQFIDEYDQLSTRGRDLMVKYGDDRIKRSFKSQL